MYLESMVDGVLKGLGEQWATFRYSLLDSLLRIAGIWVLLPRFGIRGFLAVMAFSNLATCFLNTTRMLRCTKIRPQWQRWALMPLTFAAVAVAAVVTVRRLGAQSDMAGLLLQAVVLCIGYLLPALTAGKKIAAPLADKLRKAPQKTAE
ncbi:MAG: polysaccharide biosynthesis C-terminal domain-containing protein [Gemmiger sp.]